MFGLASGIYQSYFGTPQLNVLLLGGESAGKTTLLERLKVTQFAKKGPIVKRSFSCPAPPKYANAKVLHDHDDDHDDDHDHDDDDHNNNHHHQSHPSDALQSSSERVQPSRRWLDDKQQSSLEDVDDYNQPQPQRRISNSTITTTTTPPTTTIPPALETPQEFNLKPGAHMLPLQKIRPTSKCGFPTTQPFGLAWLVLLLSHENGTVQFGFFGCPMFDVLS
jgi:hypothetical protein